MGNYEFRDVPITRRAMRQLIVELFCDGKAMERKKIINTCVAEHIKRGGIEGKRKDGPSAAFKSATNDLRELGLAEKGGHWSYWRILIPAGSSTSKKLALYAKQNGICNGCAKGFDSRNLTVDHKIPDGNDDMNNLQLLCGSCNSVKGDRTHVYLLDKLLSESIITKKQYRRLKS